MDMRHNGGESPKDRSDVISRLGVRIRKDAIEDIAEALKLSGHRSLDQQAKALGLPRATAWTIVTNKHKVGRLSKETVTRILKNSKTPQVVRVIVQHYLAKRGEA